MCRAGRWLSGQTDNQSIVDTLFADFDEPGLLALGSGAHPDAGQSHSDGFTFAALTGVQFEGAGGRISNAGNAQTVITDSVQGLVIHAAAEGDASTLAAPTLRMASAWMASAVATKPVKDSGLIALHAIRAKLASEQIHGPHQCLPGREVDLHL